MGVLRSIAFANNPITNNVFCKYKLGWGWGNLWVWAVPEHLHLQGTIYYSTNTLKEYPLPHSMVLGAQAVQNRTSFITLVATLWYVLLHIAAKHFFVFCLFVIPSFQSWIFLETKEKIKFEDPSLADAPFKVLKEMLGLMVW